MKYNNTINVGDIVNVIFTRNDIFDWQEAPTIKGCKVIKTPAATGDTFGFCIPIKEYGEDEEAIEKDFFINPNCGDFVALELIWR